MENARRCGALERARFLPDMMLLLLDEARAVFQVGLVILMSSTSLRRSPTLPRLYDYVRTLLISAPTCPERHSTLIRWAIQLPAPAYEYYCYFGCGLGLCISH
jgi:hypothetical protein